MKPTFKTGDEKFRLGGKDLGFALKDFWSWSTSDLITNTTRGIIAEFIVAKALNAADNVRYDWDAYDLQLSTATQNGPIKIEVKSSAFVQSWSQDNYTNVKFEVKKTKALNEEASKYDGEPLRKASVYIFALLAYKKENPDADKATIDPLEISQWEFYVLPTSALTETQQSITLASLRSLTKSVGYFELVSAVQKAGMKTN